MACYLKDKANLSFGVVGYILSTLMLNLNWLYFCAALLVQTAQAQDFYCDARCEAMAGASLTIPNAWSVFNNAGAIADANLGVGAGYLNRFMMSEISEKAMATTIPAAGGVCGAGINYFGYQKYNQFKIALGYAKKLGEKLNAGITINYHVLDIALSPQKSNAIAGNIAMLYHFNNNWHFAIALNNIAKKVIYDQALDEIVVSKILVGTSYQADKVVCEVDIESKPDYGNITINTGVELKPVGGLSIRTGITTQSFNTCWGAGYDFGFMNIDFAVRRHWILGWLPSISVGFYKKN